MKRANVIIPAKEFLFDTWYGALTVWCGASALLVAMLLLDLPFAGRIWWSSIAPYVGYALLLLLLIAGIVFIAAWIVSLVKRRWKQAIVQLALGVIWTAGLLYAAAMLLFASMFGPSEDHFADELTIPPEVAENIIEPESGFEGSHFVGGLNTHFRNLLISRDEATTQLLEVSDDIRQRYAEQAKRCTPKFLYAAIRKCTDCDLNYKISQNKRLLVELTLIEISQIATGEADGNPSGLRPTKILKPIFTKQGNTAPASTTASQPASAVKSPSNQNNQVAAEESKKPSHPQQSTPPIPPKESPATSSSANSVRRFSIKQRMQSHTQGTDAAPAESSPTQAFQPKAEKLLGGVTEENIITAWHIYESQIPTGEAAIAILMRNYTPRLLNSNSFEVAVNNSLNIETLRKYESSILQHIKKCVDTDLLTMSIRLQTPAEQPKFYSKPERLKILKAHHPALDKLCKELDLDISLG